MEILYHIELIFYTYFYFYSDRRQQQKSNERDPKHHFCRLWNLRNPRNRGVLNGKARRDDIHDTEAVPAPADKV